MNGASERKESKKEDEKSRNGNGGSKESSPTKATPSSSSFILLQIVIALVSLTAGIITPPFLSAQQLKKASTNTLAGDGLKLQSENRSYLTKDTKHGNVGPQTECDDENLSQFLHDHPVEGIHVLCFKMMTEKGGVILAYKKSYDSDGSTKSIYVDFPTGVSPTLAWTELRNHLQNEFHLPISPLQQPWALFNAVGERLVGANDPRTSVNVQNAIENLEASGLVLLMEGGAWVWPGVREGFKRKVDLYPGTPGSPNPDNNKFVIIETLSLRPLVLSVENFIDNEECDHVQNLAKPHMQYSSVSLMDQDQGKDASEWRTSQSTFVQAKPDDDLMVGLERRTARLTRIPRSHQEYMQVLRYGKTEKYSTHHDFFDPSLYQSDRHTLRLIQNGKRNRLATVFCYFSGRFETFYVLLTFVLYFTIHIPLYHSFTTSASASCIFSLNIYFQIIIFL